MFFWHYAGNRFLTTLSNVFTNLNLTDMETGYKAFARLALEKILPRLCSNDFGIEAELTALVAKNKFRVYEVGISYYGRNYAEGKKIKWTDGKREFTMEGKLYDVVKKEYTQNGIVFYCIDDKQEARLFHDLDSLTEKQMEKKNMGLKNKPVLHLFPPPVEEMHFTETNTEFSFYFPSLYLQFSKKSSSPPPEA